VDILNFEDFDPIFRKREFHDVKKGALEMIDFKKITGKYNERYYQDLRQKIQQKNLSPGQEFMDLDEIEFRADDPRKKAIDDDQKKKEELLEKVKHN
jgi:hypothetical protein